MFSKRPEKLPRPVRRAAIKLRRFYGGLESRMRRVEQGELGVFQPRVRKLYQLRAQRGSLIRGDMRCALVSVARSAAKLSLRGLIVTPRRRMRGSRVAAGDTRSVLALDARVCLRHLRSRSRASTLIIERIQHC